MASAAQMAQAPRRLDGWKAIAAHFRRDRSTVMRWANDGGLPVRRIAGRHGGSVWAYAHELDNWLGHADPAPAGYDLTTDRATPAPALPADADLADTYLRSRDQWSARNPAGLRQAIAGFADVASRDPSFAPAYVGLADAYLLAPEFDAIPHGIAFPKAEAAAKAALAIDPRSVGAVRALAFLAYWARGDVDASLDQFAMARSLAPDDAQTHHWLGNVLSDIGEDDLGLAALRTARRLNPGSAAIQADQAWALWRRGPGDAGVADLVALADHGPPMTGPQNYLACIALANGEVLSYVERRERLAALSGSAGLLGRVAAERAAYEQRGAAGVLDVVAEDFPTIGAAQSLATEWSATAASLAGRRDRLLALLERALEAGEYWKPWREDQARLAPWRDDLEVITALTRLVRRPPS